MGNFISGLISLTGGGAKSLDSIDGNALSDGDKAKVLMSSGIYHYHLNATSGEAESPPDIIVPDSNAGTKAWELIKTPADDHVKDIFYGIVFYQPGVLTDGWSIKLNFSETVTFPSGLTDSKITAEEAAATAETVISIKKDGAEVGTATFAAAGSTAAISFTSAQTFTKGANKITFSGPATADATLAGLSVSMKGTR